MFNHERSGARDSHAASRAPRHRGRSYRRSARTGLGWNILSKKLHLPSTNGSLDFVFSYKVILFVAVVLLAGYQSQMHHSIVKSRSSITSFPAGSGRMSIEEQLERLKALREFSGYPSAPTTINLSSRTRKMMEQRRMWHEQHQSNDPAEMASRKNGVKTLTKSHQGKRQSETDNRSQDFQDEQGLVSKGTSGKEGQAGIKDHSAPVKFRGIQVGSDGMLDGVNVSKVSFMLYRVIKTYGIRSMVDIPCYSNRNWMPKLLERLDYEVPGFVYNCVEMDRAKLELTRKQVRDFGSASYVLELDEQFQSIPSADLLFSFGGPQAWGFRRTWKFFIQSRKLGFRFAMFTNNQGAFNVPAEQSIVNVKKPPFNFQEPLKTITDIDTDLNKKQLLLYDLESMRSGM